MALFSQVLRLSKDGDYTTSLNNLFQCLITLVVNFFAIHPVSISLSISFLQVFRDLSKCCTVTLLNQSQTTPLLLQMLYAIQKKILQANLQAHEEKMSPS